MPNFADTLANVLTIGALVAIFISLRRNNRTPRFKLWLVGWVLMLVHFVLEMLPKSGPFLTNLYSAIEVSTLAICGLVFMLSVTIVVDNPRFRRGLLLGLGSLLLVFSFLMSFDYTPRFVMVALASAMFSIAIGGFIYRYKVATRYTVAMALLMAAFGGLAVYRCFIADYEGAFYALLFTQFSICSVLVVRAFPRFTAGVAATVAGFVSWSMVWACGTFYPAIIERLGPSNDIFNFPKLLVAFGMIMTELERRSQDAIEAELRERNLSQQLSRFAAVTTRLLGGAEVNGISNDIAQAITEIGNFRRAAIVMTDDAGRPYIGGHSGLTQVVVNELQDAISRTTIEDIERTCSLSHRLGNDSVLCPREVMAGIPSVPTPEHFVPNLFWRAGDEVIVPLRSSAGNLVGCISLDDPKDVTRVVPSEMYSIEMLANHLGVAIEKASLQRKVIVREKLASIGQLVGGVAHELNNPLTVIIGYSDLLSDADTDNRFERELSTLRREARRMRSIIENLLRFARQSKIETRSANLPQAIEEALELRKYEYTRRGITVETDTQHDVPKVNIDEAQLKTVIVNLLNNSFDAVQESAEKKVSLHMRRVADRVLFSMIDTGEGFSDVTRAFDPFFSTKGVGRGSGLGLSICYGIVKQHGGDIYAQNVHPAGACVTLELRVATKGENLEPPKVSEATLWQ